MNSNQTMNAVGAFLSKLIDFVVNLLRYVVYFGVKVVGVLLIISGIAIVLSMIFGFTLPFGLPDFQWTPITNAVFASNLEFVLGAFGLLLLVGIPGLAIVYLGFRMLMDTRARIKGIVPSMLGLWIMGLLLVGVISTLVASDFRYKEEMEQTINLDEPSSGKMYLDTMKDTLAKNANNNVVRLGNFDMRIVDDQILLEDAVTLNIQKAETNDWKLLVNRSARGGSEASARRHAQHAEAMITQTDSMLKVNPIISLGKSQKWRAQQVDLTLLMPEGREIVLTEASREVIYDIANVHDMYDGDMVGHTWEMRSKGLTCKDCSGNEASKSSVAGNSRSYDIRDFDEVEIKGAFDVKMRYADEYKVVLKGEQGLLDDVDVTLQQEQLSISKQEGVSDIFNGGNIRVKVESPELEELALKGAGESSVIGYSGQSCEVTLAGATESDMNVEYEELSVDVLGASNLHLVGSGEKLKAKVLGASSMSGENYETAEADIEVAGSSNASIHVTKTLKAEVMGASELSYKGDPDIESDVAGFSSINPL